MKIQETRRKVIREWMALPRDKRENKEQTADFAARAVQEHKLPRSRRDPREVMMDWLLPRTFARIRPCGVFLVSRMCGSRSLIGDKKAVCGCFGQVHNGWYDQRARQVRYLSNAGYRIVVWQTSTKRLEITISSAGAGAPYGNRTRVSALRGPRPRPLDEGSIRRKLAAIAARRKVAFGIVPRNRHATEDQRRRPNG